MVACTAFHTVVCRHAPLHSLVDAAQIQPHQERLPGPACHLCMFSFMRKLDAAVSARTQRFLKSSLTLSLTVVLIMIGLFTKCANNSKYSVRLSANVKPSLWLLNLDAYPNGCAFTSRAFPFFHGAVCTSAGRKQIQSS
eukprot:6453905-Amphidinium_carterae.2